MYSSLSSSQQNNNQNVNAESMTTNPLLSSQISNNFNSDEEQDYIVISKQSNNTNRHKVIIGLVTAIVVTIVLIVAASLLGKDDDNDKKQDQDSNTGKPTLLGLACGKLSREECSSTSTNSECIWCTSYAIPSRCYSHDEAKQLPDGVFVCDTQKKPQQQQQPDTTTTTHKKTPPAAILPIGDNKLSNIPYPKPYLEIINYQIINKKKNILDDSDDVVHPKLCDSKVAQLSGYFHVSPAKKYFFWFFESRRNPSQDPVVLWLTGGPGCSSEIALFAENGPCSVNDQGDNTKNNQFSWNTRANLLYIDQPAGTGFSTGPLTDHNEATVSEDMYSFLMAFFQSQEANKYASLPFYITGESYAGHYVPAAAHKIFVKNQHATFKINLKGVAVGNGLTDPELQYPLFPAMAKPYVDESVFHAMEKAVAPCVRQIRACQALSKWLPDFGSLPICENAVQFCNNALIAPIQRTGLNHYDLRIKCEIPGLCYDFGNIKRYLSRPDVRQALGVPSSVGAWEDCSTSVHMSLLGDWMLNYAQTLPDLLEANIPVLIYAGDTDYICNWMGNKAWVMNLDWAGKQDFTTARDLPWKDGKGEVRSAKGFTFLKLTNCGHMAPMDCGSATLEMLDQLLFSSFETK
jgi:carboxypeptidase C (cathepsin A)